jgi:DNA-binding IclR family transcriptional regulator
MDRIEVLMRLYEAPDSMTREQLADATRLDAGTVAKAATDLVSAGFAVRDPSGDSYRFSAKATDREAVHGLAQLYHQRPVTLVKLVYAQPSTAIQSFADAFRVVDKPKDE